MTYRQKIENLISKIQDIYDEAGNLRDYATEDEKVHWNNTRRIFYDADKPLRELNSSLSNERSQMQLKK